MELTHAARGEVIDENALARLIEGELASAPRVRQGRERSLLGARLPEALARLMSPLL